MLEHDAPVGRLEDVVVADVDLVLAVRRLALAELDGHVRRGHLVAQQAMERLGLGGLEQVVVLVVVPEGARDRVAALGELLPRVLQDVELELGAGLQGEALRAAALATWVLRIVRGAIGISRPVSSSIASARTMAVPGSQGRTRSWSQIGSAIQSP